MEKGINGLNRLHKLLEGRPLTLLVTAPRFPAQLVPGRDFKG